MKHQISFWGVLLVGAMSLTACSSTGEQSPSTWSPQIDTAAGWSSSGSVSGSAVAGSGLPGHTRSISSLKAVGSGIPDAPVTADASDAAVGPPEPVPSPARVSGEETPTENRQNVSTREPARNEAAVEPSPVSAAPVEASVSPTLTPSRPKLETVMPTVVETDAEPDPVPTVPAAEAPALEETPVSPSVPSPSKEDTVNEEQAPSTTAPEYVSDEGTVYDAPTFLDASELSDGALVCVPDGGCWEVVSHDGLHSYEYVPEFVEASDVMNHFGFTFKRYTVSDIDRTLISRAEWYGLVSYQDAVSGGRDYVGMLGYADDVTPEQTYVFDRNALIQVVQFKNGRWTSVLNGGRFEYSN